MTIEYGIIAGFGRENYYEVWLSLGTGYMVVGRDKLHLFKEFCSCIRIDTWYLSVLNQAIAPESSGLWYKGSKIADGQFIRNVGIRAVLGYGQNLLVVLDNGNDYVFMLVRRSNLECLGCFSSRHNCYNSNVFSSIIMRVKEIDWGKA